VLSQADQIWNRAALNSGGVAPRAGDIALADLLCFHGRAMNGGVDHAVETLDHAQLIASAHGYLYFGLVELAAILQRSAVEDEAINLLDAEYDRSVPDDSALVKAFEAKLRSSPDDFSPLV